jgi:hypothetical protein
MFYERHTFRNVSLAVYYNHVHSREFHNYQHRNSFYYKNVQMFRVSLLMDLGRNN